MRIAYFDCFSGISGDMCLGALISAGVDAAELQEGLARLRFRGMNCVGKKIKSHGIAAVNVFVDINEEDQPERHLDEIKRIIDSSDLPEKVKQDSLAVFSRLAVAEAAIHDTTPDKVHFHEVGAVDAIVDVVGTVLGLDLLGVERIYASPLPMGKGLIHCRHGIMPSPAPATLELLRDIPVYGTDIGAELVTPTGAALVTTLAEAFGGLPAMVVKGIGYGSGKMVLEQPNLLRLIIGDGYNA
jgi:uncharacterized protein (TIGR00299 family) protein